MSPVRRTPLWELALRALPRRVLSKRTPPASLEREPVERSLRRLRVATEEELPAKGDILYLDWHAASWLGGVPMPPRPEVPWVLRVEGVHVGDHQIDAIPLPPEDSPLLGGTWWTCRQRGVLFRREVPAHWLPPEPDFERWA